MMNSINRVAALLLVIIGVHCRTVKEINIFTNKNILLSLDSTKYSLYLKDKDTIIHYLIQPGWYKISDGVYAREDDNLVLIPNNILLQKGYFKVEYVEKERDQFENIIYFDDDEIDLFIDNRINRCKNKKYVIVPLSSKIVVTKKDFIPKLLNIRNDKNIRLHSINRAIRGEYVKSPIYGIFQKDSIIIHYNNTILHLTKFQRDSTGSHEHSIFYESH